MSTAATTKRSTTTTISIGTYQEIPSVEDSDDYSNKAENNDADNDFLIKDVSYEINSRSMASTKISTKTKVKNTQTR